MSGMTGGSINAAKKRLITLIREAEPALGATEALTHVFGDWRVGMEKIYSPRTGPKLPVVTVRISPARIQHPFYGRLWTGTTYGDVGLYAFTAHCFASACTASGEERYKHAQDLADLIMQRLITRKWNQSPDDAYSICDVFDLMARESQPKKQGEKICRVIIEGSMMVRRTD